MAEALQIENYKIESSVEKCLCVEFTDGKRLDIFIRRASDVSEGLSHILFSTVGGGFLDAMLYLNVSRPLREDGPRAGFYELLSAFVTQKDFAGYLKPIVELGDSLFKSGNFNRDWEIIAISRFCSSCLDKLAEESYPRLDSLIPRKELG